MTSPTTKPGRPTPWRKRPLFVLAYLIFLLALAEGGAWTYLAVSGRGVDLDAEAELVGGRAEVDLGGMARQGGRGAATVVAEELHPYLGFMPRLTAGGGDGNQLYQVWQQRTYEPGSPLFSTDPDDLVIGLVGGSVARQFGMYGGAAHLAQSLPRTERFRGRRVRFVCVAYGGAKQPQQLMGLSYLLALGGRLDLLINLDGFNEIALHEVDNQPQGVAPIYPRAWFHRVGRSELMGLFGERSFVQAERERALEGLAGSPLALSGLRRARWVARDRELEAELVRLGEALRVFDPTTSRTALGPVSSAADAAGRLAELAAIWERSSRQLANLCAANGIEYHHFLQPNQYVEGSKPLSDEELARAYLPDQGYGAQAPAGYPLLLAAGAELAADGVRFHDLTDVYRDVEETVYKDTCCHVNELGNLLMAEAMLAAFAAVR